MTTSSASSLPLLDFISASPTCFHAIANTAARLTAAGYTPLSEEERWTLRPGDRRFVIRGGSSIIAFRVPQELRGGFMMAAAHSDSPAFKLKEHAELRSSGYIRLHTEKYGGMLMSTWFDRPLSVAGRLFVRRDGSLDEKLLNIDRDLLVIPSVAIHMNRNANDGIKYMANIDTIPLFSSEDPAAAILPMAAEAAGVSPENVLGSDLFLYCRGRGVTFGAHNEYILSPRLDDLACAWSCLEGFLAARDTGALPILCIFDNEEVGSETKQGAASAFLRDTLRRILFALGHDEEAFRTMLARSFLLSADNAHAIHPNHPEYSDGDNCPHMNAGVVIKFNANQRYATDGRSCALFRSICQDAGVPTQVMANRSDLPGGSTLGSIANTLVPVSTVDIGLAQLAMHSSYETAGTRDAEYMVRALTAFYETELRASGDGSYAMV